MGTWVRYERRGSRYSPYARAKYYWWADDEDDAPTPRDYRKLRVELKGDEVDPPTAYDDRAGMPKHPNTTGGGYRRGGDRQSFVFRKGKEPDKKIQEEFKLDLPSKREYFDPVKVDYNGNDSPIRVYSPMHNTAYDVGPKFGDDFYMVHPTYQSGFGIDMYGTNVPLSSPLPQLVNQVGSIQLTPKVINKFSGTRGQDGKSPNGVMNGKGAFEAAQAAGLNPTGNWAWLHLIAYSMGGQDGKNPDVPENLVAGTSASNIYHLAIESAAKKIVEVDQRPLKITWKLSGRIDADWHIAQVIEYTIASIKDPLKIVTFKISTWSHESAYGGDANAVYSYMKNVLKI